MTPTRTFVAASAGRLLLPALAALALILAACGEGSSASDRPVATTDVELPKSYRFVPASIVVPAGATVTWTNADDFTHNVTFEGAEPLTMRPGERASHTFDTPGRYPYQCSLHPRDMRGSVLVTAG